MVKINEDLTKLSSMAIELGASSAKALNVGLIVVDERVRLKCRVPLCDDYGVSLMCPPSVATIAEFREALSRYSHAILIQIRTPIGEELRGEVDGAENLASLFSSSRFREAYVERVGSSRVRLHHVVNKVETGAYMLGYRFAAGLIAASCRLCPRCVTVSSGEPCRHPFEARPSMEAMGIDVYETALNCGLPFEIPPGDELTLNGLVLVA